MQIEPRIQLFVFGGEVEMTTRHKMKKKCILLIPPQELPIPAVGGGAIETLITNLLDENEIYNKVRFVVISANDIEASKFNYRNSKIYYFENGTIVNRQMKKFFQIKFYILRVINKLKRILKKLGITVTKWNDYIIYPEYFYFQCYQIAKKEKADIVISEGDWHTEAYPIFYDLVGRENIYYHLHCEIEESIETRVCIPNSISISQYVKNKWVKNKNIEGNNFVLYNCIDIQKFTIELEYENRLRLRSELKICENEILVVFCGRLIPEKGVSELLDAFEMMKDYPIKLIVIGSSDFSKGNNSVYSERIVSRIEQMDSVLYLGYVPNEKMPIYYHIADIQVIPSLCQEGAGLVAIEGMASGLPLIITESGGMIEYVDDYCAIKIPIDDNVSVNLCNEILKLSKSSDLRKKMGNAGKNRAQLFTKKGFILPLLMGLD